MLRLYSFEAFRQRAMRAIPLHDLELELRLDLNAIPQCAGDRAPIGVVLMGPLGGLDLIFSEVEKVADRNASDHQDAVLQANLPPTFR